MRARARSPKTISSWRRGVDVATGGNSWPTTKWTPFSRSQASSAVFSWPIGPPSPPGRPPPRLGLPPARFDRRGRVEEALLRDRVDAREAREDRRRERRGDEEGGRRERTPVAIGPAGQAILEDEEDEG